MAPTLVWSTRSSRTTTRWASANRSADSGSGRRSKLASAPRCTGNPVVASSTSSGTTYAVTVEVVEGLDPSIGRKHRPGLVARGERTPDRDLALGEEEPLRRLARGAHLRVAQIEEVAQARVVPVRDADEAHQPPARRHSSSTNSTGVVSHPSR